MTVDWENGFVEASAKENINVSQIFKELLVQAKVKYMKLFSFRYVITNFILKQLEQWLYSTNLT